MPQPSAQPIIEFKDVSFTYAGTSGPPALRNINLAIYPGEYVALLGLNGAGKTTLLLCINGVIPNSIMGEFSGEVIVNGLDTFETEVRELAKVVGMVFDNPEFQMSQMSVDEEVALGLESLGVPYDEMRRRVREALEIVGLEGLEARSPFGLSGGQQQRLAIASALAMRPAVLVMDEPTSNVDPIGKEEIFQVAAKLNRERGMTVIVAEHEVEVMAMYADRVVVMSEGTIVANGPPEEVFAQVERLTELGLRAPQVTEFAHRLDREGLAKFSDHYPVTLDQAERAVKDVLIR